MNVVTLAGVGRSGVLLALTALVACAEAEVGMIVPDPPDFRPEPDPVRVVVTPTSDTLEQVGATTSFSAVAIGPDDQVLQSAVISWASTNTGVATVNPGSGSVTAVGPGTTEIRARSGNAQGSAELVVRESGS